MNNYTIRKISPANSADMKAVEALLVSEDIQLDKNLDYICGMFDDNYDLIGTGSCFKNSLRCIAVRSDHQGEGLMNTLITHLIEVQFDRGNTHLFVYTKIGCAKFFQDIGFHEIATVDGKLVFLENRRTGFSNYLASLKTAPEEAKKIASIVVNANPFTLGHQQLIEKAAGENDWLHIFIVSADESLIPHAARKQLVEAGTRHLTNVSYQDTGEYLISTATFPSYFLKEEQAVIETQAKLDAAIFLKIAAQLNISTRYVGTEPTSKVTGIYNQTLESVLTANGIELTVVPRFENDDQVISASVVRTLLAKGDNEKLKTLVPQTTYDFFQTAEGRKIVEKLKQSDDLIHY